MLLAQSNHFVLLFVALETVTVALYVLVAYFRESPFSLEAGLKYLVTGALSSSLLLFGIVLLYGIAGNPLLAGHTANSMNFAELGAFLRLHPEEPLALVGAALVLSGIAFKIGAVPFQIWVPDVYQGAPTPVTAFLAVASKAAGFALLLILVRGPFQPLAQLTVPLLSIFAALSLLFGNLAALGQRNVKRLMGLSGISHAGFLLVGVVASIATSDAVSWAPAAVYFYLFTYLVGAMATFGVMAHVSIDDDADQDLRHYAGLARRSPLLGAALACGVGSLAGIPPLAGFIGKLLIFVAAFQAHQWTLLAISIVAVVVSIYYYFGWIRAAFYEDVPASERNVAPLHLGVAASLTLIALALASVLLGVYQGPLGQWIAGS
jgi:NADH-quinone oxidoreductase subunit N